jgi:hypothetical protein
VLQQARVGATNELLRLHEASAKLLIEFLRLRSGDGDQIKTDPVLGPLKDNGGPTFIHALLPNSPAIDTGDANFSPPSLHDQRGPGFDRVVNARIDVGSFEGR